MKNSQVLNNWLGMEVEQWDGCMHGEGIKKGKGESTYQRRI